MTYEASFLRRSAPINNSLLLRPDDITHIAFSETTGVIALGTRKGDIRVLGRASPNGV